MHYSKSMWETMSLARFLDKERLRRFAERDTLNQDSNMQSKS